MSYLPVTSTPKTGSRNMITSSSAMSASPVVATSDNNNEHSTLPWHTPTTSDNSERDTQRLLGCANVNIAAFNQFNTQIPPTAHNPNIKIELDNQQLWNEFSQHTTEMIVTKNGRRMFPTLRYKLSGMEPNASYGVYLEMAGADDCRYKFQNGRWVVAGRAEPPLSTAGQRSRMYAHPDSPAPGRIWMRQPLSFHRIKLTNNVMDPQGHVLLNSMHKYAPRVYILRLHDHFPCVPQLVAQAQFPETNFIAVTAYQNEKVISLKIDHNPFAKGFRESGVHTEKRRRVDTDDASPPLLPAHIGQFVAHQQQQFNPFQHFAQPPLHKRPHTMMPMQMFPDYMTNLLPHHNLVNTHNTSSLLTSPATSRRSNGSECNASNASTSPHIIDDNVPSASGLSSAAKSSASSSSTTSSSDKCQITPPQPPRNTSTQSGSIWNPFLTPPAAASTQTNAATTTNTTTTTTTTAQPLNAGIFAAHNAYMSAFQSNPFWSFWAAQQQAMQQHNASIQMPFNPFLLPQLLQEHNTLKIEKN